MELHSILFKILSENQFSGKSYLYTIGSRLEKVSRELECAEKRESCEVEYDFSANDREGGHSEDHGEFQLYLGSWVKGPKETICTRWGGHLFRRLYKMFSESSQAVGAVLLLPCCQRGALQVT